jgi:hypothetical protein
MPATNLKDAVGYAMVLVALVAPSTFTVLVKNHQAINGDQDIRRRR